MKSKFSWGDAVIIKQNAPQHLHPGEFGSICSIAQVISTQEAEKLECQLGAWIYTVEFENGSDVQIAEYYLDKDLRLIRGSELSKYSSHFIHGVVLNIKMDINSIEIQMQSSPIQQAILDDFLLSNESCLHGKIIITQIENVTITNSSHSMGWQQEGHVLAFEISDHALKLLIEWNRSKTSSLEIKSGQIWWEKQT